MVQKNINGVKYNKNEQLIHHSFSKYCTFKSSQLEVVTSGIADVGGSGIRDGDGVSVEFRVAFVGNMVGAGSGVSMMLHPSLTKFPTQSNRPKSVLLEAPGRRVSRVTQLFRLASTVHPGHAHTECTGYLVPTVGRSRIKWRESDKTLETERIS